VSETVVQQEGTGTQVFDFQGLPDREDREVGELDHTVAERFAPGITRQARVRVLLAMVTVVVEVEPYLFLPQDSQAALVAMEF
jgi:hypothetical protein